LFFDGRRRYLGALCFRVEDVFRGVLGTLW
jgi:hypothetical protein